MVLDERLAMMASLGREKVPLADIGTDHAYLPIRLLLDDPDRVAMATDIRPGPLEAARRNARLYGVEDRIDFRLADGFLGLPLTEKGIRDIYLCGMGGETIAGILQASGKNLPEGTRFYLQPMTRSDRLRKSLYREGFAVLEEALSEDGNRIYEGFSAEYTGETREIRESEALFGIGWESRAQQSDLLRKRIRRWTEEAEKIREGKKQGGLETETTDRLLEEIRACCGKNAEI